MVLIKCLLPALILIGISNARPENKNLELANSQDTAPLENYPSCGTEKVCVPKFLCNEGDFKTDGRDIIDIRSKRSVGNTTVIKRTNISNIRKRSTDCSYLETCCNIPHDTKDPPLTTIPNVTRQPITNKESIAVSKTLDQNISCGYRNPDGIGFLIAASSDTETQFGEFPWMAAILNEVDDVKLYACGAALIAPTVIITAAGCVQNLVADNMIVRAGEWDTQTKDEILPHQDRQVRKIIIHENFDNGSLYNDIALVIVESPFEYQENIQSICLPPPNTNFDLSSCYATGWGKDKDGKEGKFQPILKKINLSVLPSSRCQTNLRTTRLGKYFNLHESFICAGGELGHDTCKGDGGSPLVCPIAGKKNQFYQAGIVSWGIGCGNENIPGVYGNVAHLRPWINEKLSELKINFEHFTAT